VAVQAGAAEGDVQAAVAAAAQLELEVAEMRQLLEEEEELLAGGSGLAFPGLLIAAATMEGAASHTAAAAAPAWCSLLS
jgi:hypothetical protein